MLLSIRVSYFCFSIIFPHQHTNYLFLTSHSLQDTVGLHQPIVEQAVKMDAQELRPLWHQPLQARLHEQMVAVGLVLKAPLAIPKDLMAGVARHMGMSHSLLDLLI
jgi:hypothetical protein